MGKKAIDRKYKDTLRLNESCEIATYDSFVTCKLTFAPRQIDARFHGTMRRISATQHAEFQILYCSVLSWAKSFRFYYR